MQSFPFQVVTDLKQKFVVDSCCCQQTTPNLSASWLLIFETCVIADGNGSVLWLKPQCDRHWKTKCALQGKLKATRNMTLETRTVRDPVMGSRDGRRDFYNGTLRPPHGHN